MSGLKKAKTCISQDTKLFILPPRNKSVVARRERKKAHAQFGLRFNLAAALNL
jgi:hypothetical protein